MKKVLISIILSAISFIGVAQEVTVSPTFKEAIHYADKSAQSQIWWTILAVVLFAVAIYCAAKVSNSSAIGKVLLTLVLVVASVCSYYSKPGAVWLNNDKKVDKAYLDKVGRTYILDSCFNNNLMVDAAIK
jgi:cell division protein FtsW (lipid II flippase)